MARHSLEITYSMIVVTRYLRLTFDLLQYWGYFLLPMPTSAEESKFTTKDVSILICTTGHETRLLPALRMWLETRPGAVVLVTVEQAK
ncbi:hypothetical protein CC80DRAFT_486926 [Byssothecium circinans]|uniref:Uncharacterized protein n=1 Tax=Byssothecium circinans TaxID=147558 RepID=A0A6A5UKX2_9PLEO|nr:hypothetical protein CC80DRAFT_486926 [Byssothecium circinans]